LTIQVNHKRVLSAHSGLTGEELEVHDGNTITVPHLELHDVVVVKIA
jgi:hypothetical protein